MSVDTFIDTELLTEVDSAMELPCDVARALGSNNVAPCDQPARWMVWRSCCDRPPITICDICKNEMLGELPEDFECAGCGTVHHPGRLFAHRIEKIDRRTP